MASLLLASLFGTPTLWIAPATALMIVALSGILAFVDQRRRGEIELFGNVGISRFGVATVAAFPAFVAETAIFVLAGRP